jgi:hypothetical protein
MPRTALVVEDVQIGDVQEFAVVRNRPSRVRFHSLYLARHQTGQEQVGAIPWFQPSQLARNQVVTYPAST